MKGDMQQLHDTSRRRRGATPHLCLSPSSIILCLNPLLLNIEMIGYINVATTYLVSFIE